MKHISIQNQSKPLPQPISAIYCSSFFCHFKGLIFKPFIDEFEGLLLVWKRESRFETSIHMLFMRFDIAVIWLDRDLKVVDKKMAKKWSISYISDTPAQYAIETHPARFEDFQIGDMISLSE